MWLWVLLISFKPTVQCKWPRADALFIVDSTVNIGLYNYELSKQFVGAIVEQMNVGERNTRIAYAAFTPKAKYEFNFNSGTNKENVLYRIENILYSPCQQDNSDDCTLRASVNTIASHELSQVSGNRQPIPDIIIIISSAVYRIPELLDKEVLMAPISPIHAFSITVGALDDFPSNPIKFTSSATTIKFSAYNFTVLEKLLDPLCNAANAFVKSDEQTSGIMVFLSSTAGLITGVSIGLLLLVCLLLFLCALFRYRKENDHLRHQMELLDSDYQRALAVNRGLQQMVDEKYGKMLKGQIAYGDPRNHLKSGKIDQKDGYPVGVFDTQSDDRHQRTLENYDLSAMKTNKNTGMTDSELEAYRNVKKYDRRKNAVVPLIESDSAAETVNKKNKGGANAAQTDTDATEVYEDDNERQEETGNDDDEDIDENDNDGDISEPDSITRPHGGHLSTNHPALSLPPVDIMVLIDCSSSIGINGFQHIKEQMCVFLSNVDIAPGRSRVAVVVFASEPTVYFGFDKYYSYLSIKRKIRNIPYIGGPTFLAKALLFASGILYQEQNMKNGRHRKHKFMPTPRHDRLQVLIVVSDGYSEDNYEKVSYILYEKLHVKTAAMVLRTYNREKLLPITRFEGAIFLMEQTEALSMWLWRQQRIWNENYADYIEKEKTLMAEHRLSGTKRKS